MAVRDHAEVRAKVETLSVRGARALRQGLAERRRRLRELIDKYGFRRQRDALGYWQQRVDDALERLRMRVRDLLGAARERLESARSRYGLREWPRMLAARHEEVAAHADRLTAAAVAAAHARRIRLAGYQDRLRALSPRRVLERGYCLVRRPDGTLLRVASELVVGDPVTMEFARGEADARVEAVREGATPEGADDARE
jgi:exodeoxyribonuclease VII large subunit